ncbi:MAG: DMT family transporter, partial [Cyanobacteriota bacterium]
SYQNTASEWLDQSSRRESINRSVSSSYQPTSTAKDYNENIDRLIASLDSTLRATFSTLQQDLKSYQSSLSQQLGQMYSLEKQGEAILEALVNRLKKETILESSAADNTPLPSPATQVNSSLAHPDRLGYPSGNQYHNSPAASYPYEPLVSVISPIAEPNLPTAVSPTQLAPKRKHRLTLGLVLVLLSFLLQAFEYIVISVIFNKSLIFGLFEVGGFVAPSLGNSLLILWLRMLFVVPLMAIGSTVLYPSVWQDIKQFAQSKDWILFLNILGSGFFLFLSQVLLYQALGSIAPGVAIAIFFIYPILSVLLAWVLFGVRPTLVSNLVIFSVLVGFVLMTLPGSRTSNLSDSGVGAAAGASIAFALYVILSQTSAKKLNPIPLSLMNFVIILAFSGLSLAGPLPKSWTFDVVPSMWLSLIVSSLILSGITLFSYFLNNLGLRRIDAAKASILGATVPALTALLALVTIQSHLLASQVFGLLLVTLGVAALSFERWHRYTKRNQSATKKVPSS